MNITTSCKGCIWAKYEGKTQIGCEFNKIEQYKNAGKSVVEAYDEEKEFYIIQDSVCFYGRLEEWLKDKPSLSKKKQKELLRTELLQTFPYQLIFIDYGESFSTKEEFEKTVAAWKDQNQCGKLVGISVIRKKTSKLSVVDMSEVLNNYASKWKIIDVTDEEQSDDYYIMHVIREIKSIFYVKINNSCKPNNFANIIHEYMNEKYVRFAILHDSDSGNDLVNSSAHEFYQGGSFGVNLKTIVEHRAKEQICTI